MGIHGNYLIDDKYINTVCNEYVSIKKKQYKSIMNPIKKSTKREQYYIADSDLYRRIALCNCIKMRLRLIFKEINNK